MASIIKLGPGKQPPRAIDFIDDRDAGRRKRLRLGIVCHDEAREAKLRIEKLLVAKSLNQSPDNETVRWLAGVSDTIHKRMARLGICLPRTPAPLAPKLSVFLDKHLEQRRPTLKPSSFKRLDDTARKLRAFFPADPPIDKITRNDASDWRASLRVKLTEAGTRLHCRNAKGFFVDAVERELIARSPFAKLKSSSVASGNEYYVTPEESARVLKACPSAQWRLFFGLAQYAGLRIPSESHWLTWANVDWEKRRLTVFARKTGQTRVVPILPELMPLLEAAYDEAAEKSGWAPMTGNEPVITLPRNNRHRKFESILTKAGIAPWDDLFQTLRKSAESWMAAQRLPQAAVSRWIGHSVAVSDKHYLGVPDAVYDSATGLDRANRSAAESAAVRPGTTLHGRESKNEPATGSDPESQSVQGFPLILSVDRAGIEPATHGFSVRCSTN